MGVAARSIAEHYLQSDYAAFDQEHRRGGSFGVEMLSVEHEAHEAHELADPPVPQLVIAGIIDGAGSGEIDYGDGWNRFDATPVGRCELQPANCEARFRISGPSTLLIATLPTDVVVRQFDRVGVRHDPFRSLYGRFAGDAEALNSLRTMWTAMRDGGAANNLLVDGLVIGLLGRFAVIADASERWELPALDDRRLARVVDYIESAFGTPIRMDELAGVACLSTIQFSRAFKRAIGCTPHAYLTTRRIVHAKRLLGTSGLPVREIALLCGFNSPAHFGSVFSARVGTSPGRYRDTVDGRRHR